MPNHFLAAFLAHTESRPHQTAVTVLRDDKPLRLTWLQLAKIVVETSKRIETLRAACPSSEPRIVYLSDNSLSSIVLALACQLLGLIEVPIDQRLGERSICELRNRAAGIWLDCVDRERLVGESLELSGRQGDGDWAIAALRHAQSGRRKNAPALILWTSGTTGEPKGVVLSNENLYGNAAAKLSAVPQSREDVRLTTLPLCHAYARTCDFGTWLLSGCQLAVASGFDGWETLAPVVCPTLANTVPSLAARLLACDVEAFGMDRLRLLGCGGAAMRESEFLRWQHRGVTVIQGYGLTEAGPVICSATPENASPGLVGTLVDGWESDIREDRLFVRGPHAMLGYLDDTVATRSRMDDAGWLDTGDIVEVDHQTRQFRILGRADEAIVLDNGRNIHPAPIERRVEQLSEVRHAMLVGCGRTTTLWIDTESDDHGFIEKRVRALMKDDPPWQMPREVKFFETPLSVDSGEITQKGAIRRGVIQQRRL